MKKYMVYMRIYANLCICGIILAYVIQKMLLYAEKYASFGKICEFWQNMRSNMRSHITGIPSYHYTTTQKFLHQHATMTSAIITGMTDAETQHTADITRSQSCTKITHVIMLISKKDTDFNKYNRNKLTVCKQKKTNQPTQE